MTALHVAVISGGLSLERDVSLKSGRRVAAALADRGHQVTRLDIDERLIPALTDGGFDVAYLALHGKAGEDGTIQGVLEVLGLPYTGSDAVSSALVWDKGVIKGTWLRGGVIATPPWVALSADAVRHAGAARVLPHLVERMGLPLVVKPTQGGSSLGVRFAGTATELAEGLVAAFRYHPVAMVERFVTGTEVAVSVLDGEPLPAVEIVPASEHYDYAARYTAGATAFHAPARLRASVLLACAQAAVDAYRAAGCRHVARADMIVDPAGVPWLLELDTSPGLAETSLLPLAAQSAGLSFGDLCERILRLATATTAAAIPASS